MLSSLVGLLGWFSTLGRLDSALGLEQGNCAALHLPYIGYTSWCTLRALMNCTAYGVGFLRSVTALSSWLSPDWHVRRRPAILAVHLILESAALVLLAVIRCFLQWHGVPDANMRLLLCDAWMTLLIIQLNPRLEWMVSLAVVHTVMCLGVHALLAPAPGMWDYIIFAAIKFVIPVGAIYMYESRAQRQLPETDSPDSGNGKKGHTEQEKSDSASREGAVSQQQLAWRSVAAVAGPSITAEVQTAATGSAGHSAVQEHQQMDQVLSEILAAESAEDWPPAPPASAQLPPTQQNSPAAIAIQAARAAWQAAVAAAQAQQQDINQGTAGTSQPFIPPPVAAVAPVQGPIHARPSVPINQGPSLVYESPLLHRTVAVKVLSETGGNLELSRLAATMQTAIPGLQGMYPTSMRRNVCVPGCAVYLGELTWQLQQHKHQTGQQCSWDKQQLAAAVHQAGAWQVKLHADRNGNCVDLHTGVTAASTSGCELFVFESIEGLEAAIAGGLLQKCLQDVEQAVEWQDSYAIASQSSQLTLALQLQTPCSSACCNHVWDICSRFPARNGDLSSISMRLVLSQQGTVVVDEEHAFGPLDGSKHGNCNLHLQMERSDSSVLDSSPDVGVMSLHMLPVQDQLHDVQQLFRGSQCSCGKALWHGAYGHVTILLLPDAAASELLAWIHQQHLTQRQLQPLMNDLAVTLEACSVLGSYSSELGCGQPWPPAHAWTTAADAALRAEQFLVRYSSLRQLTGVLEVCRVRLQQAAQV